MLVELRNATIHKEHAITIFEMAHSPLYTAVQASIAIANHLLGEQGSKFNKVLKKYPIHKTELFSNVALPEV
jgi:hypothetical protein